MSSFEACDSALRTLLKLVDNLIKRNQRWAIAAVFEDGYTSDGSQDRPGEEESLESVLGRRAYDDIARVLVIVPEMAAHLRLRNQATWDEFTDVFVQAPAGAESLVLLRILSMEPEDLLTPFPRASLFYNLRREYRTRVKTALHSASRFVLDDEDTVHPEFGFAEVYCYDA